MVAIKEEIRRRQQSEIAGTDRPPLLPGFGLADDSAGLMGAFLAMVALQYKNRSNKGQVIDMAIYEPLFTLLGPQGVDLTN